MRTPIALGLAVAVLLPSLAHAQRYTGADGKLRVSLALGYPKSSAIGFAAIPATDEFGLGLAAVNRMIAVAARELPAR